MNASQKQKSPESVPSACSGSHELDSGIWFRSMASGLWYENAGSAGTVSAVRIHGENYIPMPDRLSAENGAKGLLIGEFSETVRNPLHCDCGDADCEMCEAAMHHQTETMDVQVSWTTIKRIYAAAHAWFTAGRFQTDE